MNAELQRDAASDSMAITDEEVDAVLLEARGDPREAIRALLHDLAVLALDADAAVSRGYVRGLCWASGRSPPLPEEA